MDRASYNVKDASFVDAAAALPNAGSGTSYSDTFDLGSALTSRGIRGGEFEIRIEAPTIALTTLLPNGETCSYSVYAGAATSPTTKILGEVIVQTGATGTDPCAAVTKQVRLPADCPRYVRVGATLSSGAGNCSTRDMAVSLVF
jgi:hypothetical protein